ncbi:hypothetical protein [Bradyrhizobium sp.]|uniref:hypothetical protein n=1 Tax=Bradyrhizobium sp. TaxID=376 RepID=UPI00261DF3D6|nr:hypothetical protein [Bradyrhizobium sp.]
MAFAVDLLQPVDVEDSNFAVMIFDKPGLHLAILMRDGEHWLILDNRTFTIVDSAVTRRYVPLHEFDEDGVRDFRWSPRRAARPWRQSGEGRGRCSISTHDPKRCSEETRLDKKSLTALTLPLGVSSFSA